MKNYFLHSVVYAMHRVGFYYCSVKYYVMDNYTKNKGFLLNFINYFVILFRGIFKEIRIFNYKFGYYEYLEIPITTKCSLRCIGCSNLIPCYKNPKDVDIKKLLKSIEVFLQCINNIVYVRVLGGEPFVSNNLIEVLKKLIDSNKIQRIEVVTNGTIVPKDKDLLEVLSNKRIVVCISKYPNVKYEKVVNVFENYNINYRIDDIKFWMEYGNLDKRGRSLKELKKQYRRCNHVCKSLFNGQLHLCPRSSHGTDLGFINNNENDYCDLLGDKLNLDAKRKLIVKLFRKKYIEACNYCDFATSRSKKISVAEQLR